MRAEESTKRWGHASVAARSYTASHLGRYSEALMYVSDSSCMGPLSCTALLIFESHLHIHSHTQGTKD